MRALLTVGLAATMVAAGACDTGDGRMLVAPTTSTVPGPRVDEQGGLRFTGGSGTLQVAGGDLLSFSVSFCRRRPETGGATTADEGSSSPFVALQIDGDGVTPAAIPFTLSVSRLLDVDGTTSDVVTVRFGDTAVDAPTELLEGRVTTPPGGEPALHITDEPAMLTVTAQRLGMVRQANGGATTTTAETDEAVPDHADTVADLDVTCGGG